MQIYKKAALLILSINSSFTTAGAMSDVCEGGNIRIPCESRAWQFGGAALYLQPSVANSGQPGSYVTTSPGHRHLLSFSQDWGWGYQLEAGYHFLKGNDLNLNWSHYNNASSNQVTAAIAPSGVTWGGLVKSSPTWNAVNLEFGQRIDFDPSRNMRIHGGLGYAQVKTEVRTTSSTMVVRDRNSSYNGVGPRLGLDANFLLTNNWNIYAKGAGALFVGSKGFTDNLKFVSVVYDISDTTIVPEIEAKLGLQYDYAMDSKGHLIFDLGWMFINYFNVEIYEHQLGPGYEIKDANFGLQGLSLELKWMGNIL